MPLPPDYPLKLTQIGSALPISSFSDEDKLYHGYALTDLDARGNIRDSTIRLPDFSCNWSRFSDVADVRFRENGKMTDGCYSITVGVVRQDDLATPVHDPISIEEKPNHPNYSHVEIRSLLVGEVYGFEPPKNRSPKNKTEKERRARFRDHLLRKLSIEIPAQPEIVTPTQ